MPDRETTDDDDESDDDGVNVYKDVLVRACYK